MRGSRVCKLLFVPISFVSVRPADPEVLHLYLKIFATKLAGMGRLWTLSGKAQITSIATIYWKSRIFWKACNWRILSGDRLITFKLISWIFYRIMRVPHPISIMQLKLIWKIWIVHHKRLSISSPDPTKDVS